MPKDRKSASLGLRVPPRLKADLESWAHADSRTLASLIYKILVEAAQVYRATGSSQPVASTPTRRTQ